MKELMQCRNCGYLELTICIALDSKLFSSTSVTFLLHNAKPGEMTGSLVVFGGRTHWTGVGITASRFSPYHSKQAPFPTLPPGIPCCKDTPYAYSAQGTFRANDFPS